MVCDSTGRQSSSRTRRGFVSPPRSTPPQAVTQEPITAHGRHGCGQGYCTVITGGTAGGADDPAVDRIAVKSQYPNLSARFWKQQQLSDSTILWLLMYEMDASVSPWCQRAPVTPYFSSPQPRYEAETQTHWHLHQRVALCSSSELISALLLFQLNIQYPLRNVSIDS